VIIQNGTGNGGIGLIVTSATTNNGPVTIEDVWVGFNESVNSSFATNVQLYSISRGNFTNCWFEAFGTSTTHFTLDGSSSFPAINNKFVNCFFWNRETGLLIGDSTNSYVQGVSVLNCIFVNPVTCVKWYQGTGTLADMAGCQLGGSNTQIDINNVLHPQLTGCYLLNTLYMLMGQFQEMSFLPMVVKDMASSSPELKGRACLQSQATLPMASIIWTIIPSHLAVAQMGILCLQTFSIVVLNSSTIQGQSI